MIKKYEITEFKQVVKRINEPITKFGGQPVWINEPEWPMSDGWDDKPMMFVGQIALEKNILGNNEDYVIYIFVTHPESYEDDFFDPDVAEWMGGENRVIIQRMDEIERNEKFECVYEGPTLFNKYNEKYEYIPVLQESYDPEFISKEDYCKLNEQEQAKYFKTIDTNKIGGVPNFFREDAWPEGEWKLLLQLKCNFLPFVLRLGGMPVLYVMISKDFKSAGLLVQD
jgi:hypothetical protein